MRILKLFILFSIVLLGCITEEPQNLITPPAQNLTLNPLKDNVTKVVEVKSKTGRVWMDRNLGASQVASSPKDEKAYGDLYQWGRGADGHQLRTSGVTLVIPSSEVPGHSDFIIPITNSFQWLTSSMGRLWQGVDGINNPCPKGFRIPTREEWSLEKASWDITNGKEGTDAIGAFNSPLKLTVAGQRLYEPKDRSARLNAVGAFGIYVSSTIEPQIYNVYHYVISFHIYTPGSSGEFAKIGQGNYAYGQSCRCIKE